MLKAKELLLAGTTGNVAAGKAIAAGLKIWNLNVLSALDFSACLTCFVVGWRGMVTRRQLHLLMHSPGLVMPQWVMLHCPCRAPAALKHCPRWSELLCCHTNPCATGLLSIMEQWKLWIPAPDKLLTSVSHWDKTTFLILQYLRYRKHRCCWRFTGFPLLRFTLSAAQESWLWAPR